MDPSLVPVALGLAWAALGGLALAARRPRRARPAPVRPRPRPPSIGAGPVSALGRGLRRVAGQEPDPEADRLVGATVLVAGVALVLAPVVAPLVLVGGLLAAHAGRRRRASDVDEAWAAAVPDAVDLFGLALASGLTVPIALGVVAPRAPPPLGPALVAADDRFRHGDHLVDALGTVAAAGPAARPLVTVLVAAHCDGAPVVEPLARLADELRTSRRRAAEARARQVPVRMLFPLVGCTLPAFVLLTVVPPVVTALGDLRP